ncbi:MAG: o-succinylbenzoate--CoA ligase [bacterium]
MASELPTGLLSAAARFPTAEAVVTSQRIYTYTDLTGLIRQSVASLKRQGFGPHERVATLVRNDVREIVLLHALWQLGAVVVPLSHRFPAPVVREYVSELGCVGLVCDSTQADDPQLPELRRLALSEVVDLRLDGNDKVDSADRPIDNRPATIMLTSGSSGRHKAVVHSLANHAHSALSSNTNLPLGPGDRWLLSLPLNHVGGLAVLFRAALAGAAVAVPDSGVDLRESIVTLRPTHLSLVATQLKRLLSRPLDNTVCSHLKAVLVGGGPLAVDLMERGSALGLPVVATYGCTEMASQIATGRLDDHKQPSLSSGRALEFCNLTIADDGEIWVCGKQLCLGYMECGEVNSVTDAEGWFHTGDLGRLDPEGYLTVLGRKDDMFISGGENIYPAQIEAALFSHGGIEDAVVIALEDETFGHRPAAIMKLAPGPVPTREALAGFLSDHLPAYMLPVRYFAWPCGPGETALKPNRIALTRQAMTGELPEIT